METKEQAQMVANDLWNAGFPVVIKFRFADAHTKVYGVEVELKSRKVYRHEIETVLDPIYEEAVDIRQVGRKVKVW